MTYIDQLEAERDMWRARYLAAHAVLLTVAEFVDNGYHLADRQDMAAALAAYRQSIEAGALTQSPAYLQFIAAGAVTPAMAAALMAGDLDA